MLGLRSGSKRRLPVGLFRDRDDDRAGRRFQMHEKLVSIGDDFWVEDEALILAVTVAVDEMSHD